jgi:hypothetical protein
VFFLGVIHCALFSLFPLVVFPVSGRVFVLTRPIGVSLIEVADRKKV